MVRVALIWVALAAAICVPLAAAAMSPLLEWRDPIYIAAGKGLLALTDSRYAAGRSAK